MVENTQPIPLQQLSFTEVPRVRFVTRPAPTPEGMIAVMLHAIPTGYFLVDKDPNCQDCGGDGLDKRPDAPTVASITPYCPTCVHPAIEHFGRVWEERLAEESAEAGDKNLEKRLMAARARVAELMASKDAALGQNVLDVAATKARIEELKAKQDQYGAEDEEYKRRLREATKEYDQAISDARAQHAEETRAANERLAATTASVKVLRDNYVAGHGKALQELADESHATARERTKAEEELRRYEAGPAKIAKRWDEKIEPARKTLERLERQWRS
jgi:hypothetical protein